MQIKQIASKALLLIAMAVLGILLLTSAAFPNWLKILAFIYLILMVISNLFYTLLNNIKFNMFANIIELCLLFGFMIFLYNEGYGWWSLAGFIPLAYLVYKFINEHFNEYEGVFEKDDY